MNPTNESTDSSNTTHRSRWQRFSPSMGWKAFSSEMIIVIFGVLIALAANEAVQNWSWQKKVQAGEQRLQQNLRNLFYLSVEQYVSTPCLDAQLTAISEKLAQSSGTWVPLKVHNEEGTTLRFVVRNPSKTQAFPAWDSLVADGTTAYFPQNRLMGYGQISARIARIQGISEEINQLSRKLMTLSHPMALSDDTRRFFLMATEESRALIQEAEVMSEQRITMIDGLMEPKFSASEVELLDAGIATSGTVKFCKAQGYPIADWRDALKP